MTNPAHSDSRLTLPVHVLDGIVDLTAFQQQLQALECQQVLVRIDAFFRDHPDLQAIEGEVWYDNRDTMTFDGIHGISAKGPKDWVANDLLRDHLHAIAAMLPLAQPLLKAIVDGQNLTRDTLWTRGAMVYDVFLGEGTWQAALSMREAEALSRVIPQTTATISKALRL